MIELRARHRAQEKAARQDARQQRHQLIGETRHQHSAPLHERAVSGRRNLFGKDRSLSLVTRVSFRPRNNAADPSALATDAGGYGFNEYLARLAYGER